MGIAARTRVCDRGSRCHKILGVSGRCSVEPELFIILPGRVSSPRPSPECYSKANLPPINVPALVRHLLGGCAMWPWGCWVETLVARAVSREHYYHCAAHWLRNVETGCDSL